MEPALAALASAGFRTVTGRHLYDQFNQFAGADALRLQDLQHMLDDETLDAILIARGGYGTVRLLDGLNFEQFRKKPKWIIGYSDVTALHAHVNHLLQTATLHAIMPVNVKPESGNRTTESILRLMAVLRGDDISYELTSHALDRSGDMSGEVIGGNLSVLYSINGSKSMPDTNGKILFLEDLGEFLYHIDRMMMAVDRAGHLAGLAGLVVGGMTDMNDNEVPYGATAEEIIRERVDKYAFPVKFGFPAGHQPLNLPLMLGVNGHLQTINGQSVFTQKQNS